nr:MAG TPA: hypothetical protein [Caudoviricetes sp.]
MMVLSPPAFFFLFTRYFIFSISSFNQIFSLSV